jgi:hypothetical protein
VFRDRNALQLVLLSRIDQHDRRVGRDSHHVSPKGCRRVARGDRNLRGRLVTAQHIQLVTSAAGDGEQLGILGAEEVAGSAGQPALEADRIAAHQLGNRVAVVDGIESPVRPDGGITNSVDHLLPHPAGLQVEGDNLGFGSQQVDQSLVQVRTDDPANSWQGPLGLPLGRIQLGRAVQQCLTPCRGNPKQR